VSEPVDREQNARVRERFTRTAEAFTRLAVSQRAEDGERIARLAQARAEDVCLDLACGPGTFTTVLARQARLVFGLDLTPAFLSVARQRAVEQGAGNILFLCGDATAMPFRDEAFDVAICGYSFHHMREPLRALRELARVISRGGRLAVVDIFTPEGFDPSAADRIEQARDESHVHTFDADELGKTVERAGFRVQASETLERPRQFSQWMQIAGWKPDDPAWRESRRWMEKDVEEDASGFHPRLPPASGEAEPEIEFIQSALFLAATKS
jgi:ubiquinone/menaquinone biosynthesis C-methylase UbiE